MSFTPGPWKWHWRFEDELATGSVFAEQWTGHAYAVAMCPRYQTKERWEADARLIAAAPDLLAALKRARIDLEAAKIVIESYKNASAFGIVQTLEIVAAALSKAEGHIGQELAPDSERRGTAK